MNTFMLALTGRDVAFLILAAAMVVLYFGLRAFARSHALPAAIETRPDDTAPAISPRSAQTLVNTRVEEIRHTGVQLELIEKFAHCFILEVRRSSKVDISASGLLELLRSIAGVDSVSLGGGKSKGAGRRTPITVYFQEDHNGHHAALSLVEAIA